MTKRDQSKKAGKERGAAIVEAAIVGPVVFFFIFMVFFGALFARAYLSASDAAAAGARSGGVAAQNELADHDVLASVSRAMAAVSPEHVRKIVVFRATDPDRGLPAGCLDTPGPGCNHYDRTYLDMPEDAFLDRIQSEGQPWPPSMREGGQTRLGVYVELDSGSIGGPLPKVVSKTFTAPIEVG